jgi:exopolyphosphatase/guanosine-5'-triphosphate,3'-diphosphate pyrophosphatase
MRALIAQKVQALRPLFQFAPGTKMIAVAGTPTTLAAVDQAKPFARESIDGYVLKLSRLRHWVERLSKMTVEERQALPGMEPKRADVLVAGSLILVGGAEVFGLNEMEVSTRGLRYGLARALATEI